MQRTLIAVVLVLFGALSLPAMLQHGYVGIWEVQFRTWAGMQVLADLAIALVLVLAWIWKDAKAAGRNPWPWIAATLTLGSFAPLVYLLTRRRQAARVEVSTRAGSA
ncbi:hypothetical protein ASD15_13710 [Massilia sp. Root351]|jgi:hypothetical protein|uniref:hypothetical protein n=1 Tax=Massilia sp. Root351 TaxID=1736522 RepID=UPI00070D8DF8|nr:hypothetical protein [Massilia sp. Root351]KQV80939.1 hypothetical protein ASD15_13710 [Massilia sp. Root351]